MREIYQKYFELPEEGKGIMSEQVFLARLTVGIACIVLCISAMGFSAYAFFTTSVSSNMNQIQAAHYSLSVQSIGIVPVNGNGSVVADTLNPTKYKLQKGMYDFVLVKEGNASTGYCMIKINNNENDVIVTRQIGDVALTVRIEVAQETAVEFVACWGTYRSQERFDEGNKMIIVDDQHEISIVDRTDIRSVSATAEAPLVTSETTTTENSESTGTPDENETEEKNIEGSQETY